MTTNNSHPSHYRNGIIAAVSAYSMWGMLPLYFVLLKAIPATEILAHRVLWSLLFGIVIISLRRQWSDVCLAFTQFKILKPLLLTSALVGINWGVFIVAIQESEIFQSSLAYYMVPMLNILMGVVLLHEKLRMTQWAALSLAMLGVIFLAATGGGFPVYALAMAVTFAWYGYVRKQAVAIGVVPSLFVETVLLAPIAAIYLGYLFLTGDAVSAVANPGLLFWIVLSGPFTLLPLFAFAVGARRLPLSTLGFLQFIAPTLQFIVGILTGEPFTFAHQVCFACIWIAATILIYDLLKKRRKPAVTPLS